MALPGNKDIKVTASDALEFEPVAAAPRKGNFGLKLFVVLVLFGGAAGAWNFFGDGLMQRCGGGDGGDPMIRAQTGPVKVRPENPGGLKFPDRDKLVYDRMQKSAGGDGGQVGGQVGGRGPERLLPPPEQPLPRPIAKKAAEKPLMEKPLMEKTGEKAATLKPDPKPAPTRKTKPVAKVPTVKDVKAAKRPLPPPPPAAPPSSSSASGQAFKTAPAQKVETPKAPKQAAPKPQPVAKAPTPAPVKSVAATPSPAPAPAQVSRGDAYLIQLAAARSSQGARTEWDRLKAKHGDLLGTLGLTVTKADLGPGKGIFYRLRAGPLVSETAARALCRQLAQRKVGCLIIKPTR